MHSWDVYDPAGAVRPIVPSRSNTNCLAVDLFNKGPGNTVWASPSDHTKNFNDMFRGKTSETTPGNPLFDPLLNFNIFVPRGSKLGPWQWGTTLFMSIRLYASPPLGGPPATAFGNQDSVQFTVNLLNATGAALSTSVIIGSYRRILFGSVMIANPPNNLSLTSAVIDTSAITAFNAISISQDTGFTTGARQSVYAIYGVSRVFSATP